MGSALAGPRPGLRLPSSRTSMAGRLSLTTAVERAGSPSAPAASRARRMSSRVGDPRAAKNGSSGSAAWTKESLLMYRVPSPATAATIGSPTGLPTRLGSAPASSRRSTIPALPSAAAHGRARFPSSSAALGLAPSFRRRSTAAGSGRAVARMSGFEDSAHRWLGDLVRRSSQELRAWASTSSAPRGSRHRKTVSFPAKSQLSFSLGCVGGPGGAGGSRSELSTGPGGGGASAPCWRRPRATPQR